jgi:hypothetical protein
MISDVVSNQPCRKRGDSILLALASLYIWSFTSGGVLSAQQTAGTISGVVSDGAGAVIPSATVTVTNEGTGIERRTTSNETGLYVVSDLLPASYEITVSANGFKRDVAKNVRVVVDQNARLDFHLELGDVTQAVEVHATEAPLLSTVSSKMDTVIEAQQITGLPLNGRQFAQLILLTPGALPITIGTATSFKVQLGAGSYAPVISGQRSRYNSFTLDGIENTDPMFNSYAMNPSVDAIQEFSVQSRGEAGEFARSMGSTVVVVTRSGANQFHGSAWEFLRNNDLDARNFFDPQTPAYKQNQFGATFGGPLRLPHYDGHNRTFFFGYYEGYRATRSANSITTVPTSAMQKGDFSAVGLPTIYDINTTVANAASQAGYSRSPFPNNIIPASRVDPNAALTFSTVYPLPNRPGVSSNYVNTTPNRTQNDQGSLRVDHKISDANNLFGRISYNNGSQLSPGSIPADYANLINVAWNSTVSDTHIFRSNLIGHAQFGVTRYTSSQLGNSLPSNVLSATGWNSTYPSAAPSLLILGLTMADAAGVSGQFTPIGPHTSYNSIGDITWIHGRHTLKFGITWIDLHSFQASPQATINFTRAPTSNLINQQTTGYGPATFLLGLVTDSRRTIGDTSARLSNNQFSGFIQDEWRLARKLTITAGLGYDYFQAMKDQGDLYAGLDILTGNYLVAAKNPITNAPPNVRQRWVDPDWHNFAPRLGIAYLLGDRTTLRAGGGIFYSQTDAVQMFGDPAGNWPFGNSQIIGPLNQYFADTTMENPFLGSPTLTLPPNPYGQGGYALNPRMKTPYASEWNASIQRQLGSGMVVEMSYVGSNAVKLLNRILNNNATSPGPGSVQLRRQWPLYGAIRWDDNSAPANYNGLTLKLQKRFSHGLTFLTNYAWSHALDVFSSDRGGVSNGAQDPNNWRNDYATSNGSIKQAFLFSDVWELPFGHKKAWVNSGPASQILGGWEWSNILGFYGGQPISVLLGFDNANVGNVAQRPNLVGNPTLSNPTPQKWFNTAAFAAPAPFTYGTAGRNISKGPGIRNWDIALQRNFAITERIRLQFRAEAFNTPNFVNFGLPVANYSASNFGQVLSAAASRDIQFSLKLAF